MLAHLTDASIRSLLLALAAAIALWIPRGRRTAALQHAVWTAVVCGMLALLAFGQALPRLPLRIPESPADVQTTERPAAPMLFDGFPEPAPPVPRIRVNPGRPIGWIEAAEYGYGAVAFLFLAQFATGMFLVRKLLGTAPPFHNLAKTFANRN